MPKTLRLDIHDFIGADSLGEGVSSKSVINDLRDNEDAEEIIVSVNSPGGVVFDAIAIYNELKTHDALVTVHVVGLAASAASLVAMAGDRVLMGRGAALMIHRASGMAMGNAKDMEKMGETLEGIDAQIIDIYAERTGMDAEQIEQWMDQETWFDGTAATQHGFADGLLADDDDAEDLAVAAYQRGLVLNMTFKNTPPAFVRDKGKESPSAARPNATGAANHHNRGEGIPMSGETQLKPDATTSERAQAEPKGATLQQLKAALPKADSDFVLSCLESEMTIHDALQSYVARQDDLLADQEAKIKAQAVEAPPKRPGFKAEEDGGEANDPQKDFDPIQKWNALVADNKKRGLSIKMAVREAVRHDPDLHADYLAAYNDQHTPARRRVKR